MIFAFQKMDALLPYEYEIIEQALSEDSLNIVARGLCIERIFSHLLKAFCVRTNLVIVVNATKEDTACFQEHLSDADALPRSLTTETTSSVTERVKIYKTGGVLFVTSRILILDFLTNRIPVEFLTALFIYRAERLLLSHQVFFNFIAWINCMFSGCFILVTRLLQPGTRLVKFEDLFRPCMYIFTDIRTPKRPV